MLNERAQFAGIKRMIFAIAILLTHAGADGLHEEFRKLNGLLMYGSPSTGKTKLIHYLEEIFLTR